MKHTITSLLIGTVLLLLQLNATATIRRVNFNQTVSPVAGVDYANFQLAHDASVNGDTIQIYGASSALYTATGTISKKLTILAPGYYYNGYNVDYQGVASIPNTGLQLVPGATGGSFGIAKGSAGTVLQGFYGLTLNTENIPDSLNNISVFRSIGFIINFNNGGVCNNWLVSQCFGGQINQGGYDNSFTSNRTITNLRIENSVDVAVNYNATNRQSPVGVNSGQYLNCLFSNKQYYYQRDLNNSVFVVQNCIDVYGVLGCASLARASNAIFINNITSCGSANNFAFTNPGSTGNIFNLNTGSNSVFLGYPSNTSGGTTLYAEDSKWQLAANSIAKGAGLIPGTNTPTDCGIYGGSNPYKASGIPAIPAFYKLNSTSPTATTNPYIITFSVRGNN